MLLSHQTLLELLDYDPETGLFKWKISRRGVVINKEIGTDNGFGYLRITVLGKSYYAHRLAWFYVNGYWPKFNIDHINGKKGDNRISNLRDVDGSINNLNKAVAPKNSKSKTLGVSWHKKANKWQAHICVYKERKYLGLFKNIFDAEAAYKAEKDKLGL